MQQYMKTKNTTWEKEFDLGIRNEEPLGWWREGLVDESELLEDKVKDFIKSLILKEREEERKEVLAEVTEGLSQVYRVMDNADFQKKIEEGYEINEVKELLAELSKN